MWLYYSYNYISVFINPQQCGAQRSQKQVFSQSNIHSQSTANAEKYVSKYGWQVILGSRDNESIASVSNNPLAL